MFHFVQISHCAIFPKNQKSHKVRATCIVIKVDWTMPAQRQIYRFFQNRRYIHILHPVVQSKFAQIHKVHQQFLVTAYHVSAIMKLLGLDLSGRDIVEKSPGAWVTYYYTTHDLCALSFMSDLSGKRTNHLSIISFGLGC